MREHAAQSAGYMAPREPVLSDEMGRGSGLEQAPFMALLRASRRRRSSSSNTLVIFPLKNQSDIENIAYY